MEKEAIGTSKEELKQVIDELEKVYNDEMKNLKFKAIVIKMNEEGVEIGIKLIKK